MKKTKEASTNYMWYASVTNGAESIVRDMISKKARDIRCLESALVFKAASLIKSPCFHQLFYLLSEFYSKSIVKAVGHILRQKFSWPKMDGQTFRIIIMERGKLRPLQPYLMHTLEKMVMSQTHMRPNRSNPDTEIWINRHGNDRTFFMVRHEKATPYNKRLQKGELRPDIIEIMLYLSKIRKNAHICDPFGGSGAIAAHLSAKNICSKITTGDIDAALVKKMKKRLSSPVVEVLQLNALEMPLQDNLFDAIITDPPWGEYIKLHDESDDAFYSRFIAESKRTLKNAATLTFLTTVPAVPDILALHNFSYSAFPISINGKQTVVYVGINSK